MLGKTNRFVSIIALISATSFAPVQGAQGQNLTRSGFMRLELNETSTIGDPMLQFSSKLMLNIEREKKNVIFSPVSIHCALNLVLLGAKDGSNTEKELLKILGYGERQESKKHEVYEKLIDEIKETLKLNSSQNNHFMPPKLDIWNMLIANEDYEKPEKSYLNLIKKYYKSDIRSLKQNQSTKIDKLIKEINNWAEAAGFNSDIVSSEMLKEDFSLILLSAVRVEAFWFDSFYEFEAENSFYNYGLTSELVKKGTFLSNGDINGHFLEFSANIVSGENSNDRYKRIKTDSSYKKLSKLDFYAVEVPLQGVSFVCLVPNKKNGDGTELLQLEDELMREESNLGKVLSMLDQHPAEIDFLRLPKFNYEGDFDLKKSLKTMGLKSIFDRKAAELSKINPMMKQYISEAKHHAMIEVNKAGLRAAGVTKLRLALTSLKISNSPIKLEIDRPFLFLVRYKSIPLFMGHLMKI